MLVLIAVSRLDLLHLGAGDLLFSLFELFLEHFELTRHTHHVCDQPSSVLLGLFVDIEHETFVFYEVQVVSGELHKVVSLKVLVLLVKMRVRVGFH